ncbi:hypothetical protein L1049_009398 [Liquidambar formosana]|uniref:Transcription factor Iwr1 domain-containing protein n=1 Tax=Liquidambar formosana TaxID=63359 RepID=A0AAP0S5B0_LIQFO
MADIGEGSSALRTKSTNEKPVIVRVKRKASHSRLEAFWLEISERALKRPLLDFEKLSISNSSRKDELKAKKVLVRHVETVTSSEATFEILQSFVEPNSAEASEYNTKSEERRRTFKKENQKQDQLLSKARQEQEVLAKNARFEQIWRSRKGNKEAMHDKALYEACRLYDVVRVDVEKTSNVVQESRDASLEEHMILRNYLPLLREFIPSAAEEIESDIHSYMSKQGVTATKDEYVYDLYTVKDDMDISDEDASNPFPLVHVDDDDEFYDGPAESEYDSQDSNAEDNPRNDYPDEDEQLSEEEEAGSGDSGNESEELESETASDKSKEPEDLQHHDLSEDADLLHEDYIYGNDDDNGDGYGYDDDADDDGEDWRWSYR